jgi:hypothetical protein
MKLKSLLFGSAAILAAGTGAQAADLPTAEPVEYVRICDAFGTGFYYIPGTDTCLRISGRVRVEAHWVDGDEGWGASPPFGVAKDSNVDNWTTRARGSARFDARTQTDMGLIRAFFDLQMTLGPGGTNNASDDHTYDVNSDLVAAFIQISNDWGTITAGHSGSFFNDWGSNTFGTRIGIDDPTTEQTLFGYTYAGGGGFSASVSIEDYSSAGRRRDYGGDAQAGGFGQYAGQEWPDLVGNAGFSGAWGSFTAMGVLHQIHVKDTPPNGEDDEDELGWAAGAWLNITLPVGGLGFNITGQYADGALGYITNYGADFEQNPDGSVETTQAWTVRAGLSAGFTDTLEAHLDGSYTDIDAESDVNDLQLWAVAANVVWTPHPGLSMGPEVEYNHFEPGGDGDDSEDQDVWGVMWRIQRDF